MVAPPPSPNHLIMAMRHCKISTTAGPQDARPATACEKVLHTVELLDAILGHITARRGPHDSSILRGILRLSRVNTAFYNHIHGDTLIAQELFLTPNAHNNNVTCVRAARIRVGAEEHIPPGLLALRRLGPRLPHPPPHLLSHLLQPTPAEGAIGEDAILA